MADPGFKIVKDDDEPEAPPSLTERAASAALLLGLKALSQRAIAALLDLFALVTVISAWWLWWSIPEPSIHQIVALSIYAAFVLAANFIVRRMR